MAPEEKFDAMGQPLDAKKGEPDPAALEAVGGELEPLVPVAPSIEEATPAEAVAPTGLVASIVAELQADPSQAEGLAKVLAQDPNARALLQQGQASPNAPSGHYHRNYAGEAALRVMGGVEIAHDPGFEPLPPSYMSMYLGEDETKTSDPNLAVKGADGKPLKTDEYKHFLDLKMQGKRISGNLRHDIAADNFAPGEEGVSIA